MADQFRFVLRSLPELLVGFPGQRPGGLLLSILLALTGIGLGFVLAVPVAAASDSRLRFLRWPAHGYVQIVRGVPLILLLLIVHRFTGTGRLGFATSSLVSALITLVAFSSAYQSVIIASGLRSVPGQLIEDARVIGAGPIKVFRTVRLPYALRAMRPALTNQAISLFKDTSVVVVLGVADLTTTARIALGGNVENAPFWVATYLTVGLLYFSVAFGTSAWLGRHQARNEHSGLVGFATAGGKMIRETDEQVRNNR